jgi:hypothetical protein
VIIPFARAARPAMRGERCMRANSGAGDQRFG